MKIALGIISRLPSSRAALALTTAGAMLAGCAGMPERNAALDSARTEYATVRNDPRVTSLAPVQLDAADRALSRAEQAWKEEKDRVVVDHLAYLARQRAAIAHETAQLRAAEADVMRASSERDRVRLEARAREAAAAQQAALAAQRLAQQAQTTAEQRSMAAEEAQRRAEEQRRQAAAERERALDAQRQAAEAAQMAALSRQKVEAAEARASDLEAQLRELEAKKTDRGMVVTMGDVLFDTGKADLKSGAQRTLDRVAAFLKRYPERRVAIEGFTDSTGSDAFNQKLSEERAAAARIALIDMGIPPERTTSRGFGEDFPVASNDNAAGRQMNRRVEIVISDETGAIPSR